MSEEIANTLKLIVNQIDTLNSNMDKRFDEQSKIIDLKLENQKQNLLSDINNKSKVLAQKTIDDTLKSIGINASDFSNMQRDLSFLRWFRVLCTNSFTKYLSYGVTMFFAWLGVQWFNKN